MSTESMLYEGLGTHEIHTISADLSSKNLKFI